MGRRSRDTRSNRGGSGIRQLPWRDIVNEYPRLEVLSADQVEAIHLASMDLLENQGMRVLHEGARALLAKAGASVNNDSQMVRFDRAMVLEQVARAPAEFTLHARNPARNFRVGGKHLAFTSVGGPAYCSDLDRGRRRGRF
ncbi:MAG: trimethylamine methyltransferase family protein, partial [Xanthomonadales bacterium]|nr:trimethylamine methyltransferase family protein [Xanthomonadales bacterium]